jgi:Domain of unknown function (DUF222)
MPSISGERADEVAVLTLDRRSARAQEILGWWQAVVDGAWIGQRYSSPSAWIAAATGEPIGACKRMLHLGHRLTVMPEARRMFEAGLISEQALGLLADAWAEPIKDQFTRDELMLVDWAKRLPYREAKFVIETWVAYADPNRIERSSQDVFDSRRLHVSTVLDGVGVIDGQLDAEGTEIVRKALALFSKRSDGDTRSRPQRNADALVTMAKFALERHESPVGTKRRRPKLNVALAYEGLLTKTGRSLLESHYITPEAARRLACDAGVHRMITHAGSAVVEYGRETRTVPDPLWQLLVIRDGGCRFPGCEIPAEMCDAHHAKHWADGGETELPNLVLLCWFHHHVMHEQHWSLEPLGAGHFLLNSADGQLYEFSQPRLDQLTVF